MYITNSNFAYVKSIGEFSTETFNKLKEGLESFPEMEQPMQQMVVFKRGTMAIAVNQSQITYITSGDTSEINIENIVEHLNKVNDLLGLSGKARIIMTIEGVSKANGSSMLLSKKHLEEATEILSAKGVGYRFIVETTEIKGDIRIEPLLKDDNKFFYNITLESLEVISNENAIIVLQKMFDLGINQSQRVVQMIFNNNK